MNVTPARVAVLFGGPSDEHDISVLTGLQSVHTLSQSQSLSSCVALYWSKAGEWFEVPQQSEASQFAAGVPQGSKPVELQTGAKAGFVRRARVSGRTEQLGIDAAVVCCHGGPGEDGTLQGLLDLAGVPYSGPTALGAALGMDKLASAALFSFAGLPVLPRLVLDESTPQPEFAGPYILKPRVGGSSIGIDVVADLATARARIKANVHLRHGAVLEPYRDLYDLEIAIRTWPDVELSQIARPLRTSAGSRILDYKDKYVGTEGMASAPRELPADISDDLAEKIRDYAQRAATMLGVRGVARVDFLSDGTELYVNEVNTIPGSLARYLFVKPEVSFEELLIGLATEAMNRPSRTFSLTGADGSVLRDAQSIASKLG